MKNTKIIIVALIVMVTVLAMFFYWKKSNPSQPQVVGQENRKKDNKEKEQDDLSLKLNIVRGTVTDIGQDKIIVRTESGEKEITINNTTPVYQAVNEKISPSDFKQIKKNAKVSIQYWKETSIAISVLIEK